MSNLGAALTEFGKTRLACSHAWFPEVHTTPLRELLHLAMGTAEEGGEVLGVIKKWHRYTDDIADLDKNRLHDEMSDVLIYLSMLGVVSGIDWDEALAAAYDKCVARWGDPMGEE